MPVFVVDVFEVVEVEEHESERPAVSGAARDGHFEQAIETATVVEPGERVVPSVVARDVEAQGENTQREKNRPVEALVVEPGPRVEPGRRHEQLLVVEPEGT